jgi:yecA family protein
MRRGAAPQAGRAVPRDALAEDNAAMAERPDPLRWPALPRSGLDTHEREALATFLQSSATGGRAMDLHMIQGLAAGLCLAPRLISPALWLPWVWDHEHGVQPPAFADIEELNTVAGRVMALHNEAAEHLGPAATEEGSPYVPLFAGLTDGAQPAAASFCAGFRRAIALSADDWAPLWAEWPQWQALIELPEPDAEAVLQVLQPMRRYWRGRTDRLEPLREQDIIGRLREAFEFFHRPFPSEAVALAERHREIVAPWLVQVLDEVARDPGHALQDDYVLHDFAMVLLGHWRDTRAYRPLLAWARLPYETLEMLLGDLLFETYNRALAGVCDGDLAPLIAIVKDEAASVWVRMALIDAWTLRVIEGDAPLGPLEDCLLSIGERDAARLRVGARNTDDPPIIEAVVHAASDIASERLRERVLCWFDEDLIDPRSIGRGEFEREVALPLEQRREELRQRGRSYLRDPQREIGWWAGYHDDPAPMTQRPAPAAGTVVRDTPKIGRNDPCPCGSGRKYKKCHGAT